MGEGFFAGIGGNAPRRVTLPLAPRCDQCRLDKKCVSPKMPVNGKGMRGILVVGESPGSEEDRQGRPFVGRTGQMLEASLRKIGLDMRRDCWLTNSCICHPKGDKLPEQSVDHCRPNLVRVIRELEPSTIILLGNSAVKSLLGWLWREDIGGISRWVGMRIPHQKLNAWLCPNWHPSFLLRGGKREEDDSSKEEGASHVLFEEFLKSACELEGRPWSKIPDYRKQIKLIYDHEEAGRSVREYVKSGNPVAFDYENNMLKPDSRDAEIVCCSVSDGKRTISYPWHGDAILATRELLQSPLPKISSNLKHEHRWTRKVFDCEVRNWAWDTMLAAHVLDNRPNITSIKFQAFSRLGVEEWDSHIKPFLKGDGGNGKNRIKQVKLSDLLRYCAYDALYEFLVAKLQMRELGYGEV